ncbi:unnamed protein product [Heligmosomoides polygyrus]|uniref:WHIM1 domain-containing protein n=1 Tax=Heligmosomoides polygyrus TaxID=6339 RepID=A0A3P7Y5Q5_HELPZ|nr:unnamed protein product [Heligmosomoides polygyrus]
MELGIYRGSAIAGPDSRPEPRWPRTAAKSVLNGDAGVESDAVCEASCMMPPLGEDAREPNTSVKSESNGDAHKPSSDGDRVPTVATCASAENESTTTFASIGSTADDADATVDDADLSDSEQPGTAGLARKPSAAPQIDAEQLRSDPDFAVICSFINKFFTLMRMEPVSFCQLENMFTTLEDGRVSKELVDLHLKLLRRTIMKTVSNESFEKCLLKYLNSTELLSSEKRQLETYGYVHMSILSKLRILRTLCELQLDHNLKLRESIPTALRAMDMRDTVTGVDKDGLAYYCQIDSKYGLRLYTTEQDDESGYSWTLVARDMTDLETLIVKLKEQDLGYVKNPNDKREFIKPVEGEGEPTINMVTKKGTYVDMFLDEAAIKASRMRESMVKEKEDRRNRRSARQETAPEEPQEEVVQEEEEKPTENEDGDRRVLPRRSASQKAQSNIRKYVTPRKTHEKKPANIDPSEEVKEKEENVKRDSSSPVSDDSDGSVASSDAEVDASGSSDDEFKPKTPKKSSGKRRHKKKKVVEEVEDEEDSDDDEEEVRRRAEGDFSCGLCKRSDNEDIVDYKFSEFDTVIKEACRMNESPPPPDTMKEVARPQGGAGRGKDMANIIEAQKQRDEGTPRASAGVPPRQLPKHRRKLNDLNVNDESDSDSDEYRANESEEEAAEEEVQSSSDYVPSESEFRKERASGGGGGRSILKPTQSDEDFVVSGSDDSYTGRRRKKRKAKEKARKRGRWQSESESEEEEETETYSDDSEAKRRKRNSRKRFEPSSEESNDEIDEVEMADDGDDSDAPRTRTGRPLRKAVVKSKIPVLDEDSDEEESNEAVGEDVEMQEEKAPEQRKGKKRKINSDSDSDDFQPDEDPEDEEEEEEEEEETSREVAAPPKTAVEEDPEDVESDVSEDSENDLGKFLFHS